SQSYDIDIEEVEFLRHGDTPYMARVFRPRGAGPFPAVIEAHGGAWCEGNRANNDTINSEVAKAGIVVAAIDFRHPPVATYPGSVADVNYGVRWLKANAARFSTRPELVGSMGTSSGGHLVVLNGMKPEDSRYKSVPLPGGATFDARVPYVVAFWPVICPLGRYRDRKAKPAGEQAYQGRAGAVQQQERYWLTEDAMGEGSPLLALERGDKVEFPHILYIQNPADELHPRHLMEGFINAFRAKGGKLETHFFTGPKYDVPRSDPTSQVAKAAVAAAAAFIHRETGV
ncbi:MAG TPA: alpha/beta hydrolase, partial [Stellaceae bacterium]|nr:alpha/beta hydrolase [Stellaceae bacterium]